MKWLIGVLALMWLFLPLNVRVAYSASVTLNSGEVMEGKIISETDAEIRLETANESRTVMSTRVISKSDVKSVTRDTPEQKAQQTAYFALGKYKLYPSQELTAAQYKQGIDVFEKFLSDYPKSAHAEEIRAKLPEWKAEAANLQSGKVKFADRWMIPEEKKLRSLQKQLADFTSQRNSLAVSIGEKKGQLKGLETRLQAFIDHSAYGGGPRYVGDSEEPIYGTRDSGPPNHYAERYIVGHRRVANPDRVRIQDGIEACQKTIGAGEPVLASLDAKIRAIQAELPEAQRAYEVALANSNAASAPIVIDPPTTLPSPKP